MEPRWATASKAVAVALLLLGVSPSVARAEGATVTITTPRSGDELALQRSAVDIAGGATNCARRTAPTVKRAAIVTRRHPLTCLSRLIGGIAGPR